MTEHSTSDSFGDVPWIQKAVLQLYRRNVPLLHTSRYALHMTQCYQASPALVLQVTNAGWEGLGIGVSGPAMVTEGSIWLHGYQISTPVRHFVASKAQGHCIITSSTSKG